MIQQCLPDSLGWTLVNSSSDDMLQIPVDNYLNVCEDENNKESYSMLYSRTKKTVYVGMVA